MKKIVLFGAGGNLKSVLNYIDFRHVKVIAIVDHDQEKWGMRIGAIRVCSPRLLKKIRFDYILITSSVFAEEIRIELSGMGIKNILPVYAAQLCPKEKQIFSECMNLYGKAVLRYRMLRIRQEFYPSAISICIHPYFFARKGLLKYIRENRKYIGGKCLDFGCGIKPYQQLFSTEEYVGVEIESEIKDPGVVYYDGKTLPFENDTFDSILCSQVFEHIPNLDEIITEIHRILKPGGYVLLTAPFVYPEHLKPFDFRRFTQNGIQMFMESHGFSILKCHKSGNFSEAIAQMQNVFICEKLFCGKEKSLFRKTGIFFINVKGYLLSKLYRDEKDLYLDNIVVARKK